MAKVTESDSTRERLLGVDKAEELLKGIIIPPQPHVLLKVLEEQRRPDTDSTRLADIIASDVALAAGTLKVVNSPFFGLRRKVSSVHHAVSLLGASNCVSLVTGLMLHTAFSGSRGRKMDEFWDRSNKLALVCAHVARMCTNLPAEEMYTLGLFLDCGIPLLLKKYQAYERFADLTTVCEDKPITACEDEQFGTDHAVVGYMVAKSWKLPAEFCTSILMHHDPDASFDAQDTTSLQRAVVMLAQAAQRVTEGLPYSYEWTRVRGSVLNFLGIDEPQLETLKAQVELAFQEYAAQAQ